MKVFETGTLTELASERFWELDFDQEELPGLDYIRQLCTDAFFADGIRTRLRELGVAEDTDDEILSCLVTRCQTAGVGLSQSMLKGWLKKGGPDGSPRGRDNVYQLCFALEMDARRTEAFFLKNYLERPFNYKRIDEAVYFFCLNTGRSFGDAVRLIQEVEETPAEENQFAEQMTEQIGEQLAQITDERKLVRYLVENRSSFSVQNQKAIKKVHSLIREGIDTISDRSGCGESRIRPVFLWKG